MSCAVVIPVYKSFDQLDGNEVISISQVVNVLKSHPFILVHPKKSDPSAYIKYFKDNGVKTDAFSFDDHFFQSVVSYNKLMIHRPFYKRFSNFDYILIYQTDAFVFEDRLDEWCRCNYSFIGAPWFYGFSPSNEPQHLMGVGNGGFSLRNVKDFLRVLRSFSFINSWKYIIETELSKKNLSFFRNIVVTVRRIALGNNTYWRMNDFNKYNNRENNFQEDYFWGEICKRKFDWFNVPEPERALQFSFEVHPEKLYALNHNMLPFGCHAWAKYQLSFWKPFIESYGFVL